jgi:hypothetical protein
MPAKMMSARGGAGAAGDVSVADSPLATIESLTQAAVIAVMGIAIVISNLLIIAAFLNFKGKTCVCLCTPIERKYRITVRCYDNDCSFIFSIPISK